MLKKINRRKLIFIGITCILSAVGISGIYAGQFELPFTLLPGSVSETQYAQDIANTFFQQVHSGGPDISPMGNQEPGPLTPTRTSIADLEGRRVWQVEYRGQGDIWIDAQTEKVKFLMNQRRFEELTKNPSSADKLSKEHALLQARSWVGTLGLRVKGEPEQAKLVIDKGGTPGFSLWEFVWPRKKNGYKFHDDVVLLGVDAFDGQIFGYNDRWFSDEPPSTEVKISEADAKTVAAKIADENGFGSQSEGAARLMIVNPNYQWTPNFVQETPRETRLAWVFNFDNSKDTWHHAAEIWVDAATGDFLGGSQSR